jgi:hypothetical protein
VTVYRRSSAIASLVGIAAVTIAGCTSSSNPPSATGSPTFPVRSTSVSPSAGAEQTTSAVSEKCRITSTADVARHFRASKVSEVVGTTGIGNPMCRFTLGSSNVGVPGNVTVAAAKGTSLATFRRAQHATAGAESIAHVGDRAYYLPGTATLHLIKGGNHVVLQASLKVPGSATPKPKVLRADLVGLGRSIAAGQ